MVNINRTTLSNAILNAVQVFAHRNVTPGSLDHLHVTNDVAAEMRLGVSRVPCHLQPQDLQAYVYALLALKAIARCQRNSDRRGILRLLYAAALDIAEFKFREPPTIHLNFG